MPELLVVAYGRVSTADQEDRGTIGLQVEAFSQAERREGLRIVRTYLDEDVSGTVRFGERPAAQRLLADAPELRAQGVTTVLLYEWSRIGRDPVVIWNAIDLLERVHGFRIRSLTQDADTSTPERVLMLCVRTGVDTLEREQTLRRSRDGMNRLARAGAWLGGFAPYGYRLEGTGNAKQVVPDEELIPGLDPALSLSPAAVVRMIFELTAAGLGSYTVANRLNALSVPRTDGEPGWPPGRVRDILRHPVYRGDYQWGRRRSGKKTRPVEIISRDVAALVSAELWRQANDNLSRARALHLRNPRSDYLLRGLVVCAGCGRRLTGETIRAGRDDYLYRHYRCRENGIGALGEPPECHRLAARADELEGAVWAAVEELLRNPEEALERIAAERGRQLEADSRLQAQVTAVEVALERRKADRLRVMTWCRNGLITDAEMERQLRDVQREADELQAELSRLRPVLRSVAEQAAQRAQVTETLQRLRANLDEGVTPERRRFAVERLVDRVEVRVTGRQRGKTTHAVVIWRFAG